jgi:glycosyltransferase involved in cell wall biosynthesis
MNILLTNHELLMPGGSETYCFTMAEELKRLGHQPIIFTPKPGTYAAIIQQIIPVQPLPHEIKKIDFQMAILQNQITWNVAKDLQCFKVWNSNSKYQGEMPPETVNRHTVVSEEILKEANKFLLHPTLIRNGINCEKFKPQTELRKDLTKVLLITNHFPGIVDTVKEACQIYHCDFQHIGHPEWKFDVENYINSADLVISLGRGIYEAMACGRNCIVFDYNGADGFVTPEEIDKMKWFNCSGRLREEKWNPERLAEEFLNYDPELGKELREIALKEYNIQHVIRGHLEAYFEHRHQYDTVPTEILQEATRCYQ